MRRDFQITDFIILYHVYTHHWPAVSREWGALKSIDHILAFKIVWQNKHESIFLSVVPSYRFKKSVNMHKLTSLKGLTVFAMGDYRYTELSYKITSLISRTCCLGSSGLSYT